MDTVSLAMIVRNEEGTLHRCLSTVRDLVDEVVVVDTGSSDATVAVARQFGARIFEETWTDDFARARNVAFGHVGSDYIFWLDADDVLLEEDRQRFTVLREHLDARATGYTMVYDYARDAAGVSLLRFRLPRIVRRSAGFRWVGRVHEYLEGPGPLLPADVVVTHRRTRSSGDRNLAICELMKRKGEPFTPRDRLYYANELANHGRWDEAIPLYDASAEDASLWLEDRLWAINKLADVFQKHAAGSAMTPSNAGNIVPPQPGTTWLFGGHRKRSKDFASRRVIRGCPTYSSPCASRRSLKWCGLVGITNRRPGGCRTMETCFTIACTFRVRGWILSQSANCRPNPINRTPALYFAPPNQCPCAGSVPHSGVWARHLDREGAGLSPVRRSPNARENPRALALERNVGFRR